MSRRFHEKYSLVSNPVAKFAAIAFVSLALTGLVAGAGFSGVLLAREGAEPATPAAGKGAQKEAAPASATKSGYVRRARLQPRLRDALGVFGDRLERPGKERIIMEGTLSVAGRRATSRIRLTRELGNRLHVEEGVGSQRRHLNFDGGRVTKGGGDPSVADESLLETLVNDSAEHFFAGQFEGLGTRFLGFRFRLDDGADESYTGPFYDVYQVADRVGVGGAAVERVKSYYFNSDTRLLERVRYQVDGRGAPTNVEVVLGDWQRVQGQMAPRRITRVEDGAAVFTVGVESVGFAPRDADGTFTAADE